MNLESDDPIIGRIRSVESIQENHMYLAKPTEEKEYCPPRKAAAEIGLKNNF